MARTKASIRSRVGAKPLGKGKDGKKGVTILAATALAGGLVWWLFLRNRPPPPPPPANPVVDVGNDQATTLDATSHAEVMIPFSVVADNPVNLTWTRTSGPGAVNFSPLGSNQELAQFTVPGNYLIRLTAKDVTDSRAQGFDELVVTVNEAPLEAILVPGELTVDGFASFTLVKALGDTISFVWPVRNVGNLQGAAFIRLTESGADVGTGAPFPINPGDTVDINFNPVVNLPTGVHTLAATVMEGLPPDGIPVGSAQIITLTVVSIPNLAAVGLPTIDGIVAPTSIFSDRTRAIPISWVCGNTGGLTGQARLRFVAAPAAFLAGVIGTLISIPGVSQVTLLLSVSPPLVGGIGYTCTLTMEDELVPPTILGTFAFFINT